MKTNEIYDPYLKISKYQWGEKEGTDHMKKMTPGESPDKKFKEVTKKIKESKIPILLRKVVEQKDYTLSFDGITTKNFDQCPSAYKQFSKDIAAIRSGARLGEPAGHQGVPAPETKPMTVPRVKRTMQIKNYLDV